MKEIQLRNCHKTTLVDDEDLNWLKQFRWSLSKGDNYVVTRDDNSFKYMHQAIWWHKHRQFTLGLVLDHIDGNTLNNQKTNLREITKSENLLNFLRKRVETVKTPEQNKNKIKSCVQSSIQTT
jgi:hypothetical protein